jgi:hypothetical protein
MERNFHVLLFNSKVICAITTGRHGSNTPEAVFAGLSLSLTKQTNDERRRRRRRKIE